MIRKSKEMLCVQVYVPVKMTLYMDEKNFLSTETLIADLRMFCDNELYPRMCRHLAFQGNTGDWRTSGYMQACAHVCKTAWNHAAETAPEGAIPKTSDIYESFRLRCPQAYVNNRSVKIGDFCIYPDERDPARHISVHFCGGWFHLRRLGRFSADGVARILTDFARSGALIREEVERTAERALEACSALEPEYSEKLPESCVATIKERIKEKSAMICRNPGHERQLAADMVSVAYGQLLHEEMRKTDYHSWCGPVKAGEFRKALYDSGLQFISKCDDVIVAGGVSYCLRTICGKADAFWLVGLSSTQDIIVHYRRSPKSLGRRAGSRSRLQDSLTGGPGQTGCDDFRQHRDDREDMHRYGP